MILEFGIVILLLFSLLYFWLTWHFNHWKDLDIPYLKPNIIFGNIKDYMMSKKFKGFVYDNLYRRGVEPAIGIFIMRQPQLLIRDMPLAKIIFTNEFHSFQDNDCYVEPTDFIHSTHCFFMSGSRWKTTRNKVSPALTTGRLKIYTPHMITACQDMMEYISENTEKNFDAKQFCSYYCINVVISSVYGVSYNAFRDTDTKYIDAIDKLMNPGFCEKLNSKMLSFFPFISNFIKLRYTPKIFNQVYTDVVREAISYRRSNKVRRNDFLQYILDSCGKDYSECTVDEITGYTNNILVDAVENVSIVLTHIIDIIIRNPTVKESLVNEIDKCILSIEDINHEKILTNQYLNAFVQEALRMRPLMPVIERKCTKDCEISYGGRKYKFKKGDKVASSIYSMHMDPKYFKDPHLFRPERFLESGDHPEYCPFGIGPRACLGQYFSQMQIKIFLCTLLKRFEMIPIDVMTEKVEFDVNSVSKFNIKGGVLFKLRSRQ